jgi:threonine synthase
VEPLIGRPVDVPAALAELLARPTYVEPMVAEYSALRRYLSEN